MRVSNIGLISKKITKVDEQFPAQDILLQTGQIEQFGSGVYAYGHIPYLVKKNIDNIINEVLTKNGCSELSLPILQPEQIWKESGRLDKYISEDVMLQCLTNKGNYCLAPTAEEAVVHYIKSRLTSYKQLPVTFYQIGPKFRNEIRTRGYLLRGKSFDMMDAYSFGRNYDEMKQEYEKMKNAYLEIFNKLGLKVQPVGADNGSIGGSKSEEFMCISNIGEDNILVDDITGKAFNSELLERTDCNEYLKNNHGITNVEGLKIKKAVELGHIFQLGDKYTKSMNAIYIDENGNKKNYIMGCYGIGVSRTLAMLYENSLIKKNGKIEGISLPISISPYLLYMIPKLDDNDKSQQSQFVYHMLNSNGIPVLYDDRNYLSIGSKIKDSKMIGIPYVVIFGKTLDEGYVEVENNLTGEKTRMSIENLITSFSILESNRLLDIESLMNKEERLSENKTTDQVKKLRYRRQ